MYSFESRVRYSETDQKGYLSLLGIMNYLQDCSTFQSEEIGLGLDHLRKQHRAWFLSSWQIMIDRYPRLGEKIVMSTWLYEFKGIYGYRNFMIQDGEGNYLVRANSAWFFFDTAKGRPARVTEDDIRGYRDAKPRIPMDYAVGKIALPKEYETGVPILVMKHHVDSNNHVNNAQYIAIAKELLPDDFSVEKLRAEYKKAAVEGELMIPRISWQDGQVTVALCNETGSPYAVVWMEGLL